MSNIPEGTQFIEAGCGEKGFRKFEKGCWWFFEGFWRHVDWKMGALTPVTEHPDYAVPATPWTGEGLPPVGSHVVVHDDGSLIYGQGESGEVLAHVDGCAVIRMSYGLGCFLPRCLRTTEQIAEEEKAAAIKEMQQVVGSLNLEPFQCLYDAGYRKQTAP